jgi:hypothetical protein
MSVWFFVWGQPIQVFDVGDLSAWHWAEKGHARNWLTMG